MLEMFIYCEGLLISNLPLIQKLTGSAINFGTIAGKAIVIAGLTLLGYCTYAIVSGSFGYQICPQFRQSVIIGWCGDPQMYAGYVVSSVISIVLGSFLYLMSAKAVGFNSRNRMKVAIEILFVLIAFLLLAGSMLLILNNFHIDYYG
jgi:hypothetical protein